MLLALRSLWEAGAIIPPIPPVPPPTPVNIFACDNPCVVCEPGPGGGIGPVDPANPYVNLSSEEPDFNGYIGRRWTWNPPQLGNPFYATGCIGWCISQISQEEADLCASLQTWLCIGANQPIYNLPIPSIPVEVPRSVYYNQAQYCEYNCPDGTPYQYTIAAGQFAGLTQEAANMSAYTYACSQAILNRICFSSLTPSKTCSGQVYSGGITCTSARNPITFTILGTLPDGLLLTQDPTTAFISGTPTTPGDYSFTLVATDPVGISASKVFNLSIIGISQVSPLPDGDVGSYYSEILSYSGSATTPVTWAVTAGLLPTGCTLDATTGEISGTPTVDGTFLFTVTMTDQS